MSHCAKCGNAVTEGSSFCPRCGNALQPGAAAGPQYGGPAKKRPSAWLYLIGPAVIALTSVAAIIVVVTGLAGIFPDDRFVVPGEHELSFEDGGEYLLFYEYRTIVDGVTYSTDERLTGMDITLRSVGGSIDVPLEDSSGSSTYTVGGRSGLLLATFSIDEPGSYVLAADYRGGRTGPDVALGVGRFDILKRVRLAVLVGFAGFAVGVLLLVWVLVKRRKAGATI